MSNLKQRFPSSLPPRGSPARLPALLLPLLVVAAAAELVLPHDVELPPPGAVARSVRAPLPQVPGSVGIPPLLERRSLFTPTNADTHSADATDPFRGAVFAGTVQQGARRVAVVQTPDGRVRSLPLGGEIAGWRLAELLPDGVRLRRDSAVMTVAYGQRPAGAPDQSQSKDAEQ